MRPGDIPIFFVQNIAGRISVYYRVRLQSGIALFHVCISYGNNLGCLLIARKQPCMYAVKHHLPRTYPVAAVRLKNVVLSVVVI